VAAETTKPSLIWSLITWAYSDFWTGLAVTVILAVIFVIWIIAGCPGLWILFLLGGGGDSGSSSGGGDFGGGGSSDDF